MTCEADGQFSIVVVQDPTSESHGVHAGWLPPAVLNPR